MANQLLTDEQHFSIAQKAAIIEGLSFDRVMALLSLCFLGGLFLDG